MKLNAPLVLSAGLFFAACGGQSPLAPQPLPEWLTSLIRDLETQPVANPPAFIAQYDYRGEAAYYLPARCCDISSNLYREDGTILCHPDGGFTGKGDGRCSDFLAERKNERIIWRDRRGTP